MDAEGTLKGKDVGWGLVGCHRGREVLARREALVQKAQVYDAELTGLTQAANKGTRHAGRHEVIKHLHIHADNAAAVTNVYEPKEKAGQREMVKFTTLINGFLDSKLNEQYMWSGAQDTKTYQGMRERMKKPKKEPHLWAPDHTTTTHAKTWSKEKTMERWRKDWIRIPPLGGFAKANKFPPAWKPGEQVQTTPREIFGRLTRCRIFG